MVDSNPQMEPAQCPSYAAGLGYLGVAAAVCLSNWGSAVRWRVSCVSCVGSVLVEKNGPNNACRWKSVAGGRVPFQNCIGHPTTSQTIAETLRRATKTHTPLLHIPVHLRDSTASPFPFFSHRLAHGNLACPLSTQGSVTPVPS